MYKNVFLKLCRSLIHFLFSRFNLKEPRIFATAYLIGLPNEITYYKACFLTGGYLDIQNERVFQETITPMILLNLFKRT